MRKFAEKIDELAQDLINAQRSNRQEQWCDAEEVDAVRASLEEIAGQIKEEER